LFCIGGVHISILAELQNPVNRYFWYYRNMPGENVQPDPERYATMFAALGTGARLRIVRLLLAAHPTGMVVSEIQSELGIPASTLSHHLDKLRQQGLVAVERQGTFLWYRANQDSLRELLDFLYAECCTRTSASRKV